MARDWVKFPELRNSEVDLLYWQSPHKQIFEDFRAKVTKVIDGDTIRVLWNKRNFTFPVRFLGTNAPEMNERGGRSSQEWLEGKILGSKVDILIDPKQRVGKWGRILGTIIYNGVNMNEATIWAGKATTFENRNEGKIPPLAKLLKVKF